MQIIKKLVSELVEVRAELHALQAQTQADVQTYNNVILGLQSGELPWERVQILETGQLRILEETPAVVAAYEAAVAAREG